MASPMFSAVILAITWSQTAAGYVNSAGTRDPVLAAAAARPYAIAFQLFHESPPSPTSSSSAEETVIGAPTSLPCIVSVTYPSGDIDSGDFHAKTTSTATSGDTGVIVSSAGGPFGRLVTVEAPLRHQSFTLTPGWLTAQLARLRAHSHPAHSLNASHAGFNPGLIPGPGSGPGWVWVRVRCPQHAAAPALGYNVTLPVGARALPGHNRAGSRATEPDKIGAAINASLAETARADGSSSSSSGGIGRGVDGVRRIHYFTLHPLRAGAAAATAATTPSDTEPTPAPATPRTPAAAPASAETGAQGHTCALSDAPEYRALVSELGRLRRAGLRREDKMRALERAGAEQIARAAAQRDAAAAAHGAAAAERDAATAASAIAAAARDAAAADAVDARSQRDAALAARDAAVASADTAMAARDAVAARCGLVDAAEAARSHAEASYSETLAALESERAARRNAQAQAMQLEKSCEDTRGALEQRLSAATLQAQTRLEAVGKLEQSLVGLRNELVSCQKEGHDLTVAYARLRSAPPAEAAEDVRARTAADEAEAAAVAEAVSLQARVRSLESENEALARELNLATAETAHVGGGSAGVAGWLRRWIGGGGGGGGAEETPPLRKSRSRTRAALVLVTVAVLWGLQLLCIWAWLRPGDATELLLKGIRPGVAHGDI